MSFCPKDFSKVFPYGRFNTSRTNFKLFPRLDPEKNILPSNSDIPGQPAIQHSSLYQNTTYKMTQKEQIAFYSKIGGRIR